MKRRLLVLKFVILALPGIAQKPFYFETISYLDYLKAKEEDKKLAGGFSAIDYSNGKGTVISDRGKGCNHSYMFRPKLLIGDRIMQIAFMSLRIT